MKNFSKLLLAIIVCELVGILATPLTMEAIPTWYANLAKPPFSPPNWLFGPVWTTLYAMMGIALYLIWQSPTKKKIKQHALVLFGMQLFLNFLWSLLFFGLRSPLLGFIDILLLLTFIVFTILRFKKISKIAAYLLIPYLLWVSFATLLNGSIVLLN